MCVSSSRPWIAHVAEGMVEHYWRITATMQYDGDDILLSDYDPNMVNVTYVRGRLR